MSGLRMQFLYKSDKTEGEQSPARGSMPIEFRQLKEGERSKKGLMKQPDQPTEKKRWNTIEGERKSRKEEFALARPVSKSCGVIITRSQSVPVKNEHPEAFETEVTPCVGKLTKRKHFRHRSVAETNPVPINSETLETTGGLSSLLKLKLRNSALNTPKNNNLQISKTNSESSACELHQELNSLAEITNHSFTKISTDAESNSSLKMSSSILSDTFIKKKSNLKKPSAFLEHSIDGKKVVQFSE